MRTLLFGTLWVCLICSATPALAQTESELNVLRAELAQMRADYESRIAQLEKRLDEAEKKAAEQQLTAAQTELQQTSQADAWQSNSLCHFNLPKLFQTLFYMNSANIK